jgi:DNA-binding MarR family transcriptional regulator
VRKEIEAYHADPILKTFMLFIQAAREITKYCDTRFFQESNLSTVKYIALKALAISGVTLTHADLAIWTNTERHNITTLVERMKAAGLVTTERSEEDKRLSKVSLTDKGRDSFVQATKVARGLIDEVMSDIGKVEAFQLERLLSVLRKNAQVASEKKGTLNKPAKRK